MHYIDLEEKRFAFVLRQNVAPFIWQMWEVLVIGLGGLDSLLINTIMNNPKRDEVFCWVCDGIAIYKPDNCFSTGPSVLNIWVGEKDGPLMMYVPADVHDKTIEVVRKPEKIAPVDTNRHGVSIMIPQIPIVALVEDLKQSFGV